MRQKDFLEFLLSKRVQVPDKTSKYVRNYVILSLRPSRYLLKFYTANFIGGLITFVICPQYGFGPYGGPEGFFHYIMKFGPFWCGIFCAGIYFSGANLFSLAVSSPVERKWVSNHKNSVILPWITVLFFLGMLVEGNSTQGVHRHQDILFYLSWYFGAILLWSGDCEGDEDWRMERSQDYADLYETCRGR